MSACRHCNKPLPPKTWQGRDRIWCGKACKSAARRSTRSVAQPSRPLQLDCLGCGLALAPQTALRGSPLRYHEECRVVTRKWQRCQGATQQMARYRALRAAGLSAHMAQFGMLGKVRFEVTLELHQAEDGSGAQAPR